MLTCKGDQCTRNASWCVTYKVSANRGETRVDVCDNHLSDHVNAINRGEAEFLPLHSTNRGGSAIPV